MSVLVTGGSGTLGQALRPFLPDATYLSHTDWDVTKDYSPPTWPECVIHAAALTNHQHPNASEVIETNIIGTQMVATYCRAFNIRLVYLSTHYVYPGTSGHYSETDDVRPIGTYAWSKLAGEAWAETVPNHLIIRGSWYTPEKLTLIASNAIQDAWHNRERPAEAAAKIARLVTGGAEGVYNIGGVRRTFAQLCVDEGVLPKTTTRAAVNPSLPYPFPIDSSVDTQKFDSFVRSLA